MHFRSFVLVASILLAGLGGCTLGGTLDPSHTPGVSPAVDPAWPDFPSPADLPKAISYADTDRVLAGSAYNPVLPVHLLIDAGFRASYYPIYDGGSVDPYNGLAFGMYEFFLAGYDGEALVAYEWMLEREDWTGYYIGLANWVSNAWDWMPCDGSQQLSLGSLAPYVDPSGRIIVTVAVYNPGPSHLGGLLNVLRYVRIGDRVGRWMVETVDTEARTVNPSIALDRYGNPHIAYTDFHLGNSALRHAYYGLEWEITVVDEAGDTGYFPSLIVRDVPGDDELDFPFICYRDDTGDRVVIAGSERNSIPEGNSYSFFELGPEISGAIQGCIMVDGLAYSVSYYSTTEGLVFLKFNGIDWVAVVIDGSPDSGLDHFLHPRNDGSPAISYYNSEDSNLRYAEIIGSSWETIAVDEGLDEIVGQYNHLAFGPDGEPQISYHNYEYGTTQRAYRYMGAWHTEHTFELGQHGEESALAIDSAGVPYVACMDTTTNELAVMVRDMVEETWSAEIIESGGTYQTGYSLSMVTDGQDRLHIAYGGYSDPHENALKLAFQLD